MWTWCTAPAPQSHPRRVPVPNVAKTLRSSAVGNRLTPPFPTPGHRAPLYMQHLSTSGPVLGMPFRNTSPERCYLVFTKWSLERVQLFPETPVSVKGLETTSVKHFHMLSMKNLDKWRFEVLKNHKSTPVLNTHVNYFALWTHSVSITLVPGWACTSGFLLSKPEPVLTGLRDKCSQPRMALILDYHLQACLCTWKRVHL